MTLKCPHCGSTDSGGWNWFQSNDGRWGHECWDCGNAFLTRYKLEKPMNLLDRLDDWLEISPKKVKSIFSLCWGCSQSGSSPDWKSIQINSHPTSLIYNGILFIRLGIPFLIVVSIRWSGSTTKKSRLDLVLGWKLNGRFAITARVQSDTTSAKGSQFPNTDQVTGWKCGTH